MKFCTALKSALMNTSQKYSSENTWTQGTRFGSYINSQGEATQFQYCLFTYKVQQIITEKNFLGERLLLNAKWAIVQLQKSISWRKQVAFRCDDDDAVSSVLDQHT